MKNLIICIAAMLFMASCASYQKKLVKFQVFANEHPTELAKLCSNRFNAQPIYLPGKVDTVPGKTVYLPGDSIPCPDGTKVKAPDKEVKCPPSTIQRDTLRVPDMAQIFLLQSKLSDVRDSIGQWKGKYAEKEKDLAESKKDTIAAKKASTKKDWIIWGLVGLIGIAGFLKFKGIL